MTPRVPNPPRGPAATAARPPAHRQPHSALLDLKSPLHRRVLALAVARAPARAAHVSFRTASGRAMETRIPSGNYDEIAVQHATRLYCRVTARPPPLPSSCRVTVYTTAPPLLDAIRPGPVEGLGENALFYNFEFFHVFFFGSPGEHILFRPDKVAKNCGQVLILSLKLFQSNENTVSNPRRGKEHDPSPNCIRLGPSQKVYYCSSAWSFQICAAILHAVGHPMQGNFREFPNFWYSDMARGARRGEEAGLCTAELPAHSHEKVTNCCGKMQGQLRSLKLFLA